MTPEQASVQLTRALQSDCPGVEVEVAIGGDGCIRFLAYAPTRLVADRAGSVLAEDARIKFGRALRESAEWVEGESEVPWVATVTARVVEQQRRTA